VAITEAQLTADMLAAMADGRDATDMGTLITLAIKDAFAEGRRFAWEKTWTDLTGDGTTVRFALTGEDIYTAPPEEQFIPTGLVGYIGVDGANFAADEYGRIIVEQNTAVAGTTITSGTITGVVSTTSALTATAPNIVRLQYYRRPIQPTVTTNYLPISERFLKPASFAKLHASLITNGMSGDNDRHEKMLQYWDARADKILAEMKPASSPDIFRLRGVF
jgi:hypothetical protein